MESCTVGNLLNEPCHKISLTQNIDISLFSDLPFDIQDSLLWRSGIGSLCNDARIYKHHDMTYGLVFEQKSVNCCDLFKRHKRKCKGIHKISFSLKERFKESSYSEKVRIRTLVPDSCSREYAAMFFDLSEYLVPAARS